MKIKVKKTTLENALSKSVKKTIIKKPSFLFSSLIRLLAIGELKSTSFSYTIDNKSVLKEPCLILMNHSCFLDLKIASKILYPNKYFIVATNDAFVGKSWLMKKIGCVPTNKYVSSLDTISNMNYCLNHLKTSVLMFPEAGYSFDGTSTVLPKRLGLLVKKLNVPLVTIITDGAYLHQPLYNNLKMRKTKVSATVKCLLTKEEVKEKTVQEIDELIDNEFSFDAFKSQYENGVVINDKDRAEGLERVLYKCPHCNKEGVMKGSNTFLTCNKCGIEYELLENGKLKGKNVETKFDHIPSWYLWQREEVKNEIKEKQEFYSLDVSVMVLSDHKSLYDVGDGVLKCGTNGFTLLDASGNLIYSLPPASSHSLNVDFFWYEIGDTISIGDKEKAFYCFPKTAYPVAKARLLAEEHYKMLKNK